MPLTTAIKRMIGLKRSANATRSKSVASTTVAPKVTQTVATQTSSDDLRPPEAAPPKATESRATQTSNDDLSTPKATQSRATQTPSGDSRKMAYQRLPNNDDEHELGEVNVPEVMDPKDKTSAARFTNKTLLKAELKPEEVLKLQKDFANASKDVKNILVHLGPTLQAKSNAKRLEGLFYDIKRYANTMITHKDFMLKRIIGHYHDLLQKLLRERDYRRDRSLTRMQNAANAAEITKFHEENLKKMDELTDQLDNYKRVIIQTLGKDVAGNASTPEQLVNALMQLKADADAAKGLRNHGDALDVQLNVEKGLRAVVEQERDQIYEAWEKQKDAYLRLNGFYQGVKDVYMETMVLKEGESAVAATIGIAKRATGSSGAAVNIDDYSVNGSASLTTDDTDRVSILTAITERTEKDSGKTDHDSKQSSGGDENSSGDSKDVSAAVDSLTSDSLNIMIGVDGSLAENLVNGQAGDGDAHDSDSSFEQTMADFSKRKTGHRDSVSTAASRITREDTMAEFNRFIVEAEAEAKEAYAIAVAAQHSRSYSY